MKDNLKSEGLRRLNPEDYASGNRGDAGDGQELHEDFHEDFREDFDEDFDKDFDDLEYLEKLSRQDILGNHDELTFEDMFFINKLIK